jgi:hypothetical protein
MSTTPDARPLYLAALMTAIESAHASGLFGWEGALEIELKSELAKRAGGKTKQPYEK